MIVQRKSNSLNTPIISEQESAVKEPVAKKKESKACKLIIFPSKFIDPFTTYRMAGDFHLYVDARHIRHTHQMKLGLSCQNPFKRITQITFDRDLEQLELTYTQLDFTVTPWEFVVNRLLNSGDALQKKLSHYIETLNQQLNLEKRVEQRPLEKYRAFIQYQYRHLMDLKQIYISKVRYDQKFIEEMGFGLNQFIEQCFKHGIPEISLKPGSELREYHENVIEFLKPLIEPDQPQDFYYYSHLYPQGLRTKVQFRYEFLEDAEPNTRLINLNIYLDYEPDQNRKITMAPKKASTVNSISKYYDIPESISQRCGTKKIKL